MRVPEQGPPVVEKTLPLALETLKKSADSRKQRAEAQEPLGSEPHPLTLPCPRASSNRRPQGERGRAPKFQRAVLSCAAFFRLTTPTFQQSFFLENKAGISIFVQVIFSYAAKQAVQGKVLGVTVTPLDLSL